MVRGAHAGQDAAAAARDIGNGGVVLMHVGATYTPSALPTIIDTLRARGYSLETITELAR